MTQPMESALMATGILLIAFLASLLVARVCPRLSAHGRLALAMVLGILSVPAFLFSLHYLHLLPEMQWFYQLRSITGSELLLAIPLPAMVAWSSYLKRCLSLVGYALAALLSVVPFAKPVLRPLDRGQMVDQWSNSSCLQSTESTCGPSSAATILRRLGHPHVTESSLAINAGTTSSGTEAWYLARAIRKEGARAEFQFNRFPTSATLPGILGVRLGSIGHFIAILGHQGDQWTISDPLNGEETLTTEELNRRYRISEFFLHLDGAPHS